VHLPKGGDRVAERGSGSGQSRSYAEDDLVTGGSTRSGASGSGSGSAEASASGEHAGMKRMVLNPLFLVRTDGLVWPDIMKRESFIMMFRRMLGLR